MAAIDLHLHVRALDESRKDHASDAVQLSVMCEKRIRRVVQLAYIASRLDLPTRVGVA
jgi:hypothetical protein